MGYPIDENTPNAVTSRPSEPAMGSVQRWNRDLDEGTGVPGTSIQSRAWNWLFGNVLRVCSDASVVPVSGAAGDVNLGDAMRAISGQQNRGQLSAELVYVSPSQVRFRPTHGTKVSVEIDGAVVDLTGNLTFDAATVFEGTETASLPIYLYVNNVAGVLTPHLSHTAPDLPGGTKPGYHPTNTSWRCVGTCWNDSALNIVPFVTSGGWHMFRELVPNHVHALSLAHPLGWTSLALNIPKGAREVRLTNIVHADDVYCVYGQSDAPGTLPAGNAGFGYGTAGGQGVIAMSDLVGLGSSASDGDSSQFVIGIADQNAPGIRYGTMNHDGDTSLDVHELKVLGYRCGFGPVV